MTDTTYADLVRRYTAARIADLEREIADIVNGNPDELAPQIEAALNVGSVADAHPGNPLFEDIDPSLLQPAGGTLALPDGRVVTHEQADEFLRSLGPGALRAITAPKADTTDADAAAEHLKLADAEWQETTAAETDRRLQEWETAWRRSHSA